MSGSLSIGLIGCGAVARAHHLPSLLKLDAAQLVAIADPDPNARAQAARQAGTPAYESTEELLAHPGLEAVVISAPTPVHAQVAQMAIERGLHVYLEKPVAITEAEARAVCDAARAAGGVAMAGFNRRFHPVFARARTLVQEGAIGELQWVQGVFSEPTAPDAMPEWKRHRATGGGVLLDLASHHFDLLRWLSGRELEVVAAGFSSEQSEHDTAWTQLRFSSGAEAQALFSFRGGFADALELGGTRGTLRVDRHRGTLVWRVPRRRGYGVRQARGGLTRELIALRARRLSRLGGDPSYCRALAVFIANAQGDSQPAPTLEDGLLSLELVLAAERAAEAAAAASI